MASFTYNGPVPFPGTAEEAAANFRTHDFGGEEWRCYECDSRPSHVSASYPCGADVPRRQITFS